MTVLMNISIVNQMKTEEFQHKDPKGTHGTLDLRDLVKYLVATVPFEAHPFLPNDPTRHENQNALEIAKFHKIMKCTKNKDLIMSEKGSEHKPIPEPDFIGSSEQTIQCNNIRLKLLISKNHNKKF